MTESEWLAREDPQQMLSHVHGKVSDRKLRLFACACVRQVWHLLTDQRSRNAVEVAERYADDLATEDELAAAWASTGGAARAAARDAVWDAMWEKQAALLRDIAGNPFQPVKLPKCGRCDGSGERIGSDRPFEWTPEVGYPGACLVCEGIGWDAPYRTPTVLAIAQVAYDERRPDGTLDPARLAILSDALEEAGCNDAAILAHLRSPGPHVRGCWALDLILGKE